MRIVPILVIVNRLSSFVLGSTNSLMFSIDEQSRLFAHLDHSDTAEKLIAAHGAFRANNAYPNNVYDAMFAESADTEYIVPSDGQTDSYVSPEGFSDETKHGVIFENFRDGNDISEEATISQNADSDIVGILDLPVYLSTVVDIDGISDISDDDQEDEEEEARIQAEAHQAKIDHEIAVLYEISLPELQQQYEFVVNQLQKLIKRHEQLESALEKDEKYADILLKSLTTASEKLAKVQEPIRDVAENILDRYNVDTSVLSENVFWLEGQARQLMLTFLEEETEESFERLDAFIASLGAAEASAVCNLLLRYNNEYMRQIGPSPIERMLIQNTEQRIREDKLQYRSQLDEINQLHQRKYMLSIAIAKLSL